MTQIVTAGSAPPFSDSFTNNNQPSGYTYDASGNLIVEPLSQANDYTYDAENRMTGFSGSGGNATYAYDDNDHRIQMTIQGGTTTVYIYSEDKVIAEYDNGAVPSSPSREYIYSGGGPDSSLGPQLVAKIENGTTQYYHQDHLSTRVITDGTTGSPTYGQVIGQQGHFPFGETWYTSGTTTKWLFTTYERDQQSGNNSGLDYALARFYDSRVASFCSADPVEGSPDDPQSWNRYAYARNDPVNATDPSGKFLPFLIALFALLEHLVVGVAATLAEVGGAVGQVLDNTIVITWGSGTVGGATVTGANGLPALTATTGALSFNVGGTLALSAADGLAAGLAVGGAGQAQSGPQKPVKKDCPPVPTHPPGVSVDDNIRWAEGPPPDTTNPDALAAEYQGHVTQWFDRICCQNSQWNYKGGGQSQYDAFGNFNFGATGSAIGIPANVLLRGAGLVKWLKLRPDKFGKPLGKFPYGNQPEKQKAIQDGIRYYQNNCMQGG